MNPSRFGVAASLAALAILGAGCEERTTYSAAEAPYASPPAESSAPAPAESAASPSSVSSSSSSMPSTTWAFPGVLPESETKGKFVHLQTSKGEIVFAVRPEWGANAASNFVYLAKGKFYDGLKFHRVEPGFVIQGGDPRGNGMGGPGYEFKNDEVKNLSIRTVEVQTPYGPQKMQMAKYAKGIVAMANAGRDTNGSQFFIMLETRDLPPDYSVFGEVVEGQDVVDKISVGDVMTAVTVEDKK